MTIVVNESRVMDEVRTDREFFAYATGWTEDVQFEIGDESWVATIADGRIEAFGRGSNPDAGVRLSAEKEVWAALWSARPAPGFTGLDVAATQGLRIDGDPVSSLGAYYPALQRLVQLVGQQDPNAAKPHAPAVREDAVRARYVYVDVDGVEYRVFIQEAGDGTPLLLQHSAGADSRQWRHLLADPELQRRFRMIAIDLPFHGKSLPPRLERWWKKEYQVDHNDLIKRFLAVADKLEVQNPIYLGWGKLGLDLAAEHGDRFRAIVALNPMLHHDAVRTHNPELFHYPQISESFFGALEHGKTSPSGPEANRREIHWIVSSNGLGVYKGDYEYEIDDDHTRRRLGSIAASATPMWLVAGEYDPAAFAEAGGTRDLAEAIPGSSYRLFRGVGGVGDNPAEFGVQIRELLNELDPRTSSTGE